jgi:hypothetical protein
MNNTEKAQQVVDALERLVKLKMHKDIHGKDEYYTVNVDAAWAEARTALIVWEREDD